VEIVKVFSVEAVISSFLLVASTEFGDKTQLLAFVLATRFKKPWAVISGIFVATVLNHFLAASLGNWVAQQISPQTMKWILAGTFFAFAVWILIPDKDEGGGEGSKYGAFLTTVIAFFMAEMGDKTQLSTVALAAKYPSLLAVTVGTTMGMMFSDGLAVFFGEAITQKIPMKWIRIASAILFVVFGAIIVWY
jgi:Ca2+/H+ antiporter, TMEM165/GDT1 family